MQSSIKKAALAAVLLAAWLLCTSLSQGQTAPAGKDDKPPPATDQGNPPAKTADANSLEELLARALKSNPDIQVAESKLHEADAELNRTRLLVTQKLVTLFRNIEWQKSVVASCTSTWQTEKKLFETGQTPQVAFEQSRQALDAAKAKLSDLEAELAYLTGKQENEATIRATETRARLFLRALASGSPDASSALARLALANAGEPQGTSAESLRKALDTPISLDFENVSLREVLENLQNRVEGVSFLNLVKDSPPLTLHFKKQLPLGAALQAVEDVVPGVRFSVREYGILVTLGANSPPDAMPLLTFWKGASQDKLKAVAGADGSGDNTANPPPGKLDGVIKKVDESSGLVTISIGSDAGLAKGHTLEVFRLAPAKYLGRIRIVDVTATEAVGKPVMKMHAPVQQGDHVSGRTTLN
jgi:hypothetical protein